MRFPAHVSALFGFAALAVLAPACTADGTSNEDMVDSAVDEALCSPSGNDTFLTVKSDAPASLFANAEHETAGSALPAGTIVVREALRESARNQPYSLVHVKTGPLSGHSGWVNSHLLALRAPSSGGCSNGVDHEAKARAFERGQSVTAQPLAASVAKGTLQCVVGLGQGVGKEGIGFVKGFEALGIGAFKLAENIAKREELMLLYSMGRQSAADQLTAMNVSAEKKILGALGAVSHAIPVLHRMLATQWTYYQTLDGPHQANYICQLVGRLAFEVVVFIGTGSAAEVAEASNLAKIANANRLVSESVEIPGRLGATAMIDLGHDYLSSQKGEYWLRLQDDLDGLRVQQTFAAKQRMIREVSDDMNIPSLGDKAGVKVNVGIGHGNCGNAAFSTMFSIAQGRPICTMPYLTPETGAWASWKPAFERLGVKTTETGFSDFATVEKTLQDSLSEGQMAWFGSSSATAGHGTIAIKLEGKLFHINNQGWEDALRIPKGELQPLGEWASYFVTHFNQNPIFKAIITDLKLGAS